jgi:broad specificity phosphatase PhoE
VQQALALPAQVNPLVRERCAFTCDIGSPRSALVRDWPEHDFSTVEEIWWPPSAESADAVIARADRFRAEAAAHPEWQNLLVVSHWGFILSLTGQSLANGEWLRYDPRQPPPAEIRWQA